MPRNAGFLVGIVVLVAVFALLRPNSEASGIPTPANDAVTAKDSSNSLPPQLARAPANISDEGLDKLRILDQPTESSKPQPEADNATASTDSSTIPKAAEVKTSDSSEPDPTTFTIRILNGGGKSGAAATLRADLTKQSFKISSVGNAQQTYADTIIYYQTGKRVEAELVAKKLGEPAVTLEENSIAAPADLLIVIGTDKSE